MKVSVLGWLLKTNQQKDLSSLKKFCLAVTHYKFEAKKLLAAYCKQFFKDNCKI
jgi:hypothetical protein